MPRPVSNLLDQTPRFLPIFPFHITSLPPVFLLCSDKPFLVAELDWLLERVCSCESARKVFQDPLPILTPRPAPQKPPGAAACTRKVPLGALRRLCCL